MNNLHRELAPISAAAWEEIETEASRSFKRNVAGRRIVDIVGPLGLDAASVGTGRTHKIDSPTDGISASLRDSQSLVELRVPFTVTREAIDNVDRGAKDSDWDPVRDAARDLALAEDRAIFEGYEAAGIAGIRSQALGPIKLPEEVVDYPEALAEALSALKLESVDHPYSLAASTTIYNAISETSNHGYPIRQHLQRQLVEGDILWAPALDGAYVVSKRGGDFELTIGQDVSIGYDSHTADVVNLYFIESFTFLVYTGEAAVALI
ncbi:putative bacteriocin [Gordonia araii NBRC 100433]|uniref:Type 1 encapsulin shell protein n=1 Tax=Gordonia araii NBRC 100433 TaxID=1073574 RepID=G7H6B4_9ACTN|nr:family 1 encapsulin nanocompartment shell protein [Gordonia araii]NNG96070.1 bacteriocin family protein [Gordonia araii NBRC 100433]GAB11389.1 putative bacteriocin [Gordonia araii NBRC 100433]